MPVAQWTPPRGVDTGPIPTGPAYALLGIGLAAAALGVALLLLKEHGAGRYVTGLGVTMALLGCFALVVRHSEDRDAKDGLHSAGEKIVRTAVASARNCATAPPPSPFVYPSGLLPGGGTTFTPPACARSPRDNVSDYLLESLGGYRAAQTAGFPTTGEVTVTDPRGGAQVCAVVPPDTGGSGAVTDGPCP